MGMVPQESRHWERVRVGLTRRFERKMKLMMVNGFDRDIIFV